MSEVSLNQGKYSVRGIKVPNGIRIVISLPASKASFFKVNNIPRKLGGDAKA